MSLLRWTEIHRSGKRSEYEYPIVPSACRYERLGDRRPARHEHGQRAGEALREANCDAASALREANCDASRVAWTTVAPPRETTRRDVSSTTAAAHTNYDDARDLAFPEIGDLRVTSTDNAQVKHFAKRIVESSIARAVSSHHGLR